MADEQQATGPTGQVLFQPGHAVHVEVVGGFVHDQQVGGRQQQPGQGDPHAPPARHLVHGPVVVGRVKAQAGQDPVGVGLHGVAAELLEPGLGLAELNQQAVLLVARRFADPGAQGLDAPG